MSRSWNQPKSLVVQDRASTVLMPWPELLISLLRHLPEPIDRITWAFDSMMISIPTVGMEIIIESKAHVMRSIGSGRCRSNEINNSGQGIRTVEARSCTTKDFG